MSHSGAGSGPDTAREDWAATDFTPEDYAEAIAWCRDALAEAGRPLLSDPMLAKERPWASVFQAETSEGVVWLKMAGAGTRFEVGVYDVLRRLAPEHSLLPLALDVDRSWVILPDGGELLADLIDEDAAGPLLESVFPQYAELQLALAGSVDDLLRAGVADMRPAAMPTRFDELAERVSAYLDRRGTADEHSTYHRALALRDAYRGWCADLGERPGGATLDHNDLHQWNVFYERERDGVARARFYDWGDSVVAHPFSSMLVGLGALRRVYGWSPDDRRIDRIRDAYLEPFNALGTRAELVETLELAVRVGHVARGLVWDRAVAPMGAAAPETFQTAPMECLANLLSDSYLGTS